MLYKSFVFLILIRLVLNTASANIVTITVSRSISYLQSNNVGGSGAGGILGSADIIKMGTAGSGSNSTITLTVDANATINQLIVGDVYGILGLGLGKVNGVLSFSGNYTLTVTTDVILGEYISVLGLGATSSAGSIDMTNGGYLKCRVIGVITGNPASCVGAFTAGTGTVELTGTFVLNTAEYDTFNNLIINSGASTLVMYESPTTITGNLTFTSGVLDVNINNCDIDLKGNWTNNVGSSAFAYGTHTVTFSGTGAQSVGGSASTTFYNLTVNKASGTLTLGQNETIASGGVLNLSAGPVALNQKTLTINNSATSAVTRTTGYLISEDVSTTGGKANNASIVTWAIGSTTGAHVFPFANNSAVYIPFIYNLASGSVGNLSISTYASAANNRPLPIGVSQTTDTTSSMADNSNNTVDRFWNITATSSTATASFTFTYADAEAPATGETGSDSKGLVAQQWNGSNGWAYDNNPGAGITWIAYYRNQTASAVANTVTVNGFASSLSSTKPWALSQHAHPLPVTLSQFNASLLSNTKTWLQWTTQQEINCDRFIIERSLNAQWESIGEKICAGNNNITKDYEWIDTQTPNGVVYYRLKQVDFDSKCNYSDAVSVNNNSRNINASITQSENQATINFFNPTDNIDKAQINIINALGERVSCINLANKINTGLNNQVISTQELPTGLYIIELILNETQQTLKFVKS